MHIPVTRFSSSRQVSPFPGSAAVVILIIMLAFTARPAAGAGVTVITHGLNSNVNDWIIPMADRFTSHPMFPGTQLSCYEFSVTDVSGQLTVTATFLGGTDPALSDSGEILIKLDWSSVDGFFQASSPEVANAAVEALASTNLIPSLGGRALAELPLHLIGHSRGGSVVTEMARLFGAKGIWVDHVTTLDPRPVNLLGLNDADTTTYVNVLYADNFWQSLGNGLSVPNGKPVFGAYNRQLTTLGGGYDSSHSDTHLWYHGTIELTTPATDTQATLYPTERATWWTSAESAGITAGF
jgi:pimeloyl-ACP methyl ester carboxylesterase